MMFASTSVIAFAIGITAVLMAANWLIWGLNNPRDLRRPHVVTPLGGREMVGRAIGHLTPARRAGRTSPATGTASHRDGGFKHVA